MGLAVNKTKEGKYILHYSINGYKSPKLSREEALLCLRNRLSPLDFIEEYISFPSGWTNSDYEMHPFDEKGNRKYLDWLKKVKTEEEIFEKYLKIIEELKEKIKGE